MNVQPIERNTITYYLFFEEENLYLQIDKPEGIEKAEFELKQNSNGYGRYLTFADDLQITFTPRKIHEFKKLCDLYKLKKWQNSIFFNMKIDGLDFIMARLNFSEVQTDYTYYFSCKIDVNTVREIIEAKKSTSVNLLSEKSVDEKDISKIDIVDVKTKFKKFFIDNRVDLKQFQSPSFYLDLSGDYGSTNANIYVNMFNNAINVSSEFSIIEDLKIQNLGHNPDLVTHFKADYDNTEVEFRLTDLDFDINLNRNIRCWGFLRIYNASNSVIYDQQLFDIYQSGHVGINMTSPLNFTLNKDEKIVIFFYVGVNGVEDVSGGITFNKNPSWQLFNVSRYEDTTTQCARLIDIGKQCLKSITNNSVTVNAPRFTNVGGNFYDLFATSGLFLRQFNDQPFYATWKGFLEYISTSFNCDFQINGNEVFIGHQMDFYRDVECARLPFSPNKDSFFDSPNKNIVKSGFSLGYDKYEDEKSSSNTIDSIHVSSEWYLSNSQPLIESSDDNKINYVADQYMIENVRRESFNKDSTKTIPNDKEIYVIDTITIDDILQNRSNQGFEVENLYSPETCYNLRLSVKRLIIDYFSEHLANVSQFTASEIAWKNTSYLNNPKAKTKPTLPLTVITKDIELVEGDDITLELPDPFLNGDIREMDLGERMKFNDFLNFVNNILNERGYVTFYNENNPDKEAKLFISGFKYSWENERLYNIKGERKHE